MHKTNRKFAAKGESWAEVEAALDEARAGDKLWNDPRNLRAAYDAGDDVIRVATEAFNRHLGDNVIFSTSSYPSLRRYEDDVVAMVLELMNAPEGASGSITTGGTESIVVAVKAAREWAREHRPQATAPEIIVPRTGHPAFNRAADMLGLKVVRLAESPAFRADVAAMARAVTENTVMLVGSAPPYPLGVVDPLPEIAALAEAHGLWLHVDACLGGFVLPFVQDLGHAVPTFDFSLAPVTSISADLHKYGYSGRGASALLLRDRAYARYQRFEFDDWPAGLYSTMGLAGSRNGGPVASAWAVMRYLGYDGYRERVEKILAIKQRFFDGIDAIEGLCVWGAPEGGHFSFGSPEIDIFAVADVMAERGWLCARAREPKALVLILNIQHAAIVEAYLADLAAAAAAVRAGQVESRSDEPIYIG